MYEVSKEFVDKLKAAPDVTNIVGNNIFVGPVDIAMEKQESLLYPSIVIFQVAEAVRTVPINARDTQVQLDIWSRVSQMEIETIYEAVLAALNYQSGDEGTAHVFWQRLDSAADLLEGDRRVWHRTCTFTVWAMKP